jgi:predicted enzyme related to lactoylglutathione lyase
VEIAFKNVDLSVSDVACSLEFYRQVLDFADTPESAPPHMLILATPGGGCTISLHQTGTRGGRPVQPGSTELGFETDDLEAVRSRFLTFGFGESFEAKDPDGYAISVYKLRQS